MDWNNDGKKDVLYGDGGGIYYYPNNQPGDNAPPDVMNLSLVKATDDSISLAWKNPNVNDFDGVLIVRFGWPLTPIFEDQ